MMRTGLLWYDNGNAELQLQLAQAAKRYSERLGAQPNVCYVHPDTLPGGELRNRHILVRAPPRVMPQYLWP